MAPFPINVRAQSAGFLAERRHQMTADHPAIRDGSRSRFPEPCSQYRVRFAQPDDGLDPQSNRRGQEYLHNQIGVFLPGSYAGPGPRCDPTFDTDRAHLK